MSFRIHSLSVSGNVCVVAVLRHHAFADDLDFVSLIFEQIERVLLAGWSCPRTDVLRITPDEMRRVAGWVEDVAFRAVHVHGEHPRRETPALARHLVRCLCCLASDAAR